MQCDDTCERGRKEKRQREGGRAAREQHSKILAGTESQTQRHKRRETRTDTQGERPGKSTPRLAALIVYPPLTLAWDVLHTCFKVSGQKPIQQGPRKMVRSRMGGL